MGKGVDSMRAFKDQAGLPTRPRSCQSAGQPARTTEEGIEEVQELG